MKKIEKIIWAKKLPVSNNLLLMMVVTRMDTPKYGQTHKFVFSSY